MKQLSLAARPQKMSALVGQQKTVEEIRKLVAKRGVPQAWLFHGEKGTGKTTIARLLALAVQCTHDVEFGEFCKQCREIKNSYAIKELNAALVRGVEEIEDWIQDADYEILTKGKKRVYILDEAQEMSKKAQGILRKPFEENENCVWIICTTHPNNIIDTIRSRCQTFGMRLLSPGETKKLCKRLLQKVGSELSSATIADALVEQNVRSPRLICQAVDKYSAGIDAESAASVEGNTELPTKTLCVNLVKGAWGDVAGILRNATTGDVPLIKAAVLGYLNAILLDSADFDQRTNAIAECMSNLGKLGYVEESNALKIIGAELYKVCRVFGKLGA